MRRHDKEIKDANLIQEILKAENICRVGIADGDYPYIVPMNYGYKENSFYFHSASKGRKIDLIKKSNKVSFEVECKSEIVKPNDSCEWTTKYRSLMGVGNIEMIDDFEEKRNGLQIIMEHNGRAENNFKDKMIENVFVLKLNIKEVVGKQSGEWE